MVLHLMRRMRMAAVIGLALVWSSACGGGSPWAPGPVPPATAPPVANAGPAQTEYAGREILFDGRQSSAAAGIKEWKWEYGDGSVLDTGNLPQARHTYPCSLQPAGANVREFDVRLTITDNESRQATATTKAIITFIYNGKCGAAIIASAQPLIRQIASRQLKR